MKHLGRFACIAADYLRELLDEEKKRPEGLGLDIKETG
jgi:hypothetical protein